MVYSLFLTRAWMKWARCSTEPEEHQPEVQLLRETEGLSVERYGPKTAR